MPASPKVTVLMPVHNGERYLREAVDSILAQTFADFEFLIIEDGSTDSSVAIIESYNDPRIRLVRNGSNLGLPASLNKGLEMAMGEYVARMDCDDISLPERLAMQVIFMDAHPAIGVCGTWVETIGRGAKDVWRFPSDPDKVRCSLIFGSVLAHPSVMLRRELFKKSGLWYDPAYKRAQDFELWVRASKFMLLANIGEVLLLYRLHAHRAGELHNEDQQLAAGRVRLAQLDRLGLTPSAEEFELHQAISLWRPNPDRDFVVQAETWLRKLLDANGRTKVYPEQAFFMALAERWFEVCDTATGLGPWTLKTFLLSPFRLKAKVPWRRRVGFVANCMLGRSR